MTTSTASMPFDYVDYFVVNVGSPNTQFARFAKQGPLTQLLSTLKGLNEKTNPNLYCQNSTRPQNHQLLDTLI